MALPILRRRAPKPQVLDMKSIEDAAIKKAIDAVAGAFLAEQHVSKSFLAGNSAQMPGTSWSNQGSINNRLIGRVTQNLAQSFQRAPEDLELALAEQGLCYSDDTEVLTESGWKRFAEVDIRSDRFATRNPKTKEFEWQDATHFHHYAPEPMYHFTDRSLDVLVTGKHRMLVDVREGRYGEWHEEVRTAQELAALIGDGPSGNIRIPQTSVWGAPDLQEFCVGEPLLAPECVNCGYGRVHCDDRCATCWNYRDKHNGVERSQELIATARQRMGTGARPLVAVPKPRGGGARGLQLRISGDDFAAFMGMWLAEGSIVKGRKIRVAQQSFSKGWDPYLSLLQRILGRTPYYDGRSWEFSSAPLARYLVPLGHAKDKFIPPEVKNLSARQLEIFWEFYRLGDGSTEPSGRTRIVTASKRMADDLQEVAQKIGLSASVRGHDVAESIMRDGRRIRSGYIWAVTLRTTERYGFRVERVAPCGDVFCVAVPNETLYVRRNGYPTWSCNSWGPPFPPGRPLDPFYGYKRPPRTWDYSVGENVQLTPRWNRISFPTLKAIIDSYYAAQIAIRHLINDCRSLDYQFVPPQNVQEDATDDIEKAEAFFRFPDRRQPFRAWLAEYLQDVLRYDAGTLFVRRNEAGDPIALEVVSGTSIIPLIDFFGRVAMDEDDDGKIAATIAEVGGTWEGNVVPSYLQIIEGMPWVWLTGDDVIYQLWNPLPESQYGLAPMEAVLMQANTDIRFQWHFLQYFTQGSLPVGFMQAPPDLSDPNQIAEWQETYDAIMLGDQAKLRQVHWVPHGATFQPVKNSDFDSSFPLYLMRCTAAAFGVTPSDLGFTEDVNRSCYSDDTEVLTESGWKHYWEVGSTERIATLNPTTQALEYQHPTELHTYPYVGEMVHFKSKHVDVLVTPEHRMWVKTRSEGRESNEAVVMTGVRESRIAQDGGRQRGPWSVLALCQKLGISRTTWRAAENGERVRRETALRIASALPDVSWSAVEPAWPTWKKVEAQELEGSRTISFADVAIWEGGNEYNTFLLPGVEANNRQKADRLIEMDLWLEFLGYVVSEGCVYRPNLARAGQRCKYVVTVSQSDRVNPEKSKKMGQCLDRLPIAFNSYVDKNGGRTWQVSDKALWTWLSSNVGHLSGDKRLPVFAHSLNQRQLSILFEALMLGDGSEDRREGCTGRSYFSKSAQLAGEVQEIAIKLGYRAQVGRGTGVWVVSMSEPRGGYAIRPSTHVTREEYTGTVWCFHVENGLFATRRNGKVGWHSNTGATQADVQFRVGTMPVVRHVEDLINSFIAEQLHLKARIQFDTGREVEDRLGAAQAEDIYIKNGTLSPDEVRMRLGKRVSRDRPTPRLIDNVRSGPIPLLALDSVAGKIDPTTFGPAKEQQLLDHPYVPIPGTTPIPKSPNASAATAASINMQDNSYVQNADPKAPKQLLLPDGTKQKKPNVKPPKPAPPAPPALPPSPVAPVAATKALADAMDIIGTLLGEMEKGDISTDNTGGPGVTRGFSNPTTRDNPGLKDSGAGVGTGAGGQGLTVATGIQGSDLIGSEGDEDALEEKAEQERQLRQWKENAKNRTKKGLAPRRFDDVPKHIADRVWANLEGARTVSEVNAAFAAVGKAPAR